MTTPALAMKAAALSGVNGFVYPGMSPTGGTLAGIPTLVSDQLAAGRVVLADASQIATSDGGIVLDSASHASVQLNDAPSGAAGVSLWQNNLLGLRAERYLGFRAPPGAVAVLDGATWTTP